MVTVYFATNRDVIDEEKGKFGERFNELGPQFYRVGVAELDIKSNDKDEGYKITSVKVEKEIDKGDQDGNKKARGSSKLFDGLRATMKKQERDIIVYIHGFANTV